MQTILEVITAIRKLKSEHQLSLKTEIAELVIHADEPKLVLLREQEQLIKGIAQAHAIEYSDQVGKTGLEQADGSWTAIISVD